MHDILMKVLEWLHNKAWTVGAYGSKKGNSIHVGMVKKDWKKMLLSWIKRLIRKRGKNTSRTTDMTKVFGNEGLCDRE